MFSSDNGPWYQGSPGKLRGRKGMTWEGGVREPFLARWPGRIPKGLVSKAVAGTIDILPTVAKLCGAAAPAKPLDGVDIWPLLSGKAPRLEREVLLYFDNWNVQCARWNQWKLHLARYNSVAYSPAPAVGRMNLILRNPELYNVDSDPDESYDVAPEHPQVVAEMRARVEKLLEGFPEAVRTAYAETKARPVAASPVGAVTRPAAKKQ